MSFSKALSLACAVSIVASGCATTPGILDPDPVRAELQVKAEQFRYTQLLWVQRVGHQVLSHLPVPETRKLPGLEPKIKPRPYTGILMADITPLQARVFRLNREKGIVISGVVPVSPADRSGIQAGDILMAIDGKEVHSAPAASDVLEKGEPNRPIEISVIRQAAPLQFQVVPSSMLLPIRFTVSDSEQVNASILASGHLIVTYGLLRFIKSDDELAVVIGHELAHLVKGHMTQNLGTAIMAGIIGGAIAGAIGGVAPGVGQPVGRIVAAGIQSGHSKERELEADEVGLEYVQASGFNPGVGAELWERLAVELPRSMAQVYLATHPSSPDRMTQLRIKAESLTGLSIEVLQDAPSIQTPPTPTHSGSMQHAPFLSKQIDRLFAEALSENGEHAE